RDELERTRQVMEDNIERVVERNERIGLLVDKTDRLTELSNGFRGSATRVKRAMWWHNFK
ncbi:synaptobrevin family protein CYBJADRAFT_117739, partial [Cyberlindnera jadinii NRRL Y-1542]